MMDNDDFLIFLRMMSKRGFYEVLMFINDTGSVQYNQVQKYAISSKIVSSQASITIILNGLTNLGLLTRTVVDGKPPGTKYNITKQGKQTIAKFHSLQDLFKTK